MKKRFILGLSLALFIFILASAFLAAAEVSTCKLTATLVNQDPYPAIPGERVKLVFQVEGVDNPNCGTVSIELVEDYPFTLDPGSKKVTVIESGTHTSSSYRSFLMTPYDIRVDAAALDGDTPIELRLGASKGGTSTYETDEFNVNIQDVRTNFEVSVKDYQSATNTLTFEILNIGESDIEALTIDIPKQDNIEVKGSNRYIIGGLDSNEDTTFSFEAVPKEGDIKLEILYTDSTNTRRTVEEMVSFDSEYFKGRVADKNSTPAWVWVVVIVVVIALIVFLWIRGMTQEAITKFDGQNIQLVCEDVSFDASYSGDSLDITNLGNVPIFGMNVKEIGEGSYTTKNLREESLAWPETGLNQGGVFSDTMYFTGEEIVLIPVLIGESDSGRKTYVCDENQYGYEILI